MRRRPMSKVEQGTEPQRAGVNILFQFSISGTGDAFKSIPDGGIGNRFFQLGVIVGGKASSTATQQTVLGSPANSFAETKLTSAQGSQQHQQAKR